MQIVAASVFFFVTMVLNAANGDPFLYLPQHMLPPPGFAVKLPYNGYMSTMRISGIYAVETVAAPGSGMAIGYRTWQLYDGDHKSIVYGFSYLNGTYVQAEIDPNTQKCSEAFVTALNCTGWSKTETLKYNNRCTYHRFDYGITADLSMSVQSASADPSRPLNLFQLTTIPGSTENSTMSYNFLSKVNDKFPLVKCYF